MKYLQKHRLFYAFFGLYLLVGAVFLWQYDKRSGHLLFNEWHSAWGDALFPYITHLGDGLFSVAVVLALLCYRYYWALLAALSFISTSLLAQFLKRGIFDEVMRPKLYFANENLLRFVEGVEVHSYNSFPSGHASSAFACFTLLALLQPNRWRAVFFFFMALLISYSRIYLQQHFFVDIYAGACIGVGLTSVIFYLMEKSALATNTAWQNGLLRKN
jgi:membrane-associated phospholipid phosphatase